MPHHRTRKRRIIKQIVSHFENAKNTTADKTLIEIADGLKHISHAIEEDIRTLEQDIRSLQNQRAEPS